MKALAALAVALTMFIGTAVAQDKLTVLVAKPDLGEFYQKTVIVVAGDIGVEIGFIINRPATLTGRKQTRLGELFPTDEPSKKLNAPVWLGGPVNTTTVWALAKDTKGAKATIPVGGTGYHMVMSVDAVDALIAEGAATTSFYAGFIIWQPEEREAEMQKGFWFKTEMTMDELQKLSKDEKGWEMLMKRLKSQTSI